MLLLKNHQLAVSVENYLHPELLLHLADLRVVCEKLADVGYMPAIFESLTSEQQGAVSWLRSRLILPNVLDVPFLHPSFCDMVLSETKDWPFTGNEEEPEHLRCPEAVLGEVCPQLERTVGELFRAALTPVYTLTSGAVPARLSAAQLTRYTLARNSFGGWHQDRDSDFTAVVELAPELHTGGGTDVMSAPLTVLSVPTLAKGHALLFPGKTTHHRGRPITEGVRDLLVMWTESK